MKVEKIIEKIGFKKGSRKLKSCKIDCCALVVYAVRKLHSSKGVVPRGLIFENSSGILFMHLFLLYLYGQFYIISFSKILNDNGYLHAKGCVSRQDYLPVSLLGRAFPVSQSALLRLHSLMYQCDVTALFL